MNLQIEDRTAVITGADSGIGKATAKMLAGEGVNLVLNDIKSDELDAVVAEVKRHTNGSNRVLGVVADLTHNEQVLRLAERTKEAFGGADIVVNCAGIRGAAGDFLELSDEDWYETINVDLMAAVRVCRAFIPQLREKGWGRVVLISSENASQPYAEESPYNACKAAIINLSKCLSRAYGEEGLRINTVSPAYVKTPMTDAMMEELAEERGISEEEAEQWFLENKRPEIKTDRRGKPEEVAAMIAFLCSERANYITGSNYRVDGGAVQTALG